MKILKTSIIFLIVIYIGFLFLNNYINSQDFIIESGTIWFYKYLKASDELFLNFKDGICSIFNSITDDTRNNLFVLFLYPVYFFYKTSYKAYIFGNFLIYYLPTLFLAFYFVKNLVLNKCKDFPIFQYIILYTFMTIPLYAWLVVSGFNDLFPLGLFIIALIIFVKYPFDNKISFKHLFLFSILLYLSFLFRRWFIFVVLSFLISGTIYLYLKNLFVFIKYQISPLDILKKRFLYIFKNITLSGLFFSTFIFLFQKNIFLQFFNSDLKTIFDGYKLDKMENFYIWNECFNFYPLYILLLLSFIFTIKDIKNSKWIIFSFINITVYYIVFSNIQTLYLDHFSYLIFWLYIIVIITLYKLCLYIKNKTFKTGIIVSFLLIFLLNFINTTITPLDKRLKYLISKPSFLPYKVINKTQIKSIEKELKQKIENDDTYTYCIWAFEEQVFNYQLFFQDDYKKHDISIPSPLVDLEALYFNWFFFPVINTNEIWVTEPLDIYLKEEDSRILFKTTEMLKNKEGFGASYKLSKVINLENNYKALQYIRIKPLTKEEQENYKKIILEMYPNTDKYYPETYDDLYKKEKKVFTK